VTYDQADKFCTARKERLCRISEYCASGEGKEPKGGSLVAEKDVAWAPVYDRKNEWVFVAKDRAKLCQTYSKLHKKKPEWGITGGFTGTIQCCKDDGTPRDSETEPVATPAPKPNHTAPAVVKVHSKPQKAKPTVIQKPKPKPTPKPTPIELAAKKIQAKKEAQLAASTNVNESAEKMARAEQQIKAFEKLYWKREAYNKRTGEEAFKEEYKDALFRIKSSMKGAVKEAKRIIKDAKDKKRRGIKTSITHKEMAKALAEAMRTGELTGPSAAQQNASKVKHMFKSLPVTPAFHPKGHRLELSDADRREL